MPPRGVKKGTKRARQYEHIKESQKEQGASEDRAEEIAAAHGEQGARAQRRVARSNMTKDQLQRAVAGKKS